jgi:hypothetical protein
MTKPRPQSGVPDTAVGRATVAHRLYESLMDLSEEALAGENQALSGDYGGLWDALNQSLDAAAALAASLRDLEKAESLKGLDVQAIARDRKSVPSRENRHAPTFPPLDSLSTSDLPVPRSSLAAV